MHSAQQDNSQPKARSVVACSGTDTAFTDRVKTALKARGFESLVSLAEIHTLEDWLKRIDALIGRADAVVFVLMSDALVSDVLLKKNLQGARPAQRRRRFMHVISYTLLIGIIVGFLGEINQSAIKEQWSWYTTQRPFAVSSIWPYVLTADAERALKPLASFRECARNCPEMIVMPAGVFTMGSLMTEPGRYDNEGPQHEITFAKPFAVSKFDVTFADWEACVLVGGCIQAKDSGMGYDTKPVINVSWDDAQHYVAWLSKMTGKTYRLLSEAEWEYAARAGSMTAYYWGNAVGRNNADCNGCGSRWDGGLTAPVGSFTANQFDLYDMAGDVWQWTQDCYHNSYDKAPKDGSAWTSGDCSRHVVRGGSWDSSPQLARSGSRENNTSGSRVSNLGFRVGRTLLSP